MTKEKASDTFKANISNIFPDIQIEGQQKTIDVFSNALNTIAMNFDESTYAKYLEEKPKDIDMPTHLAKIPDGVENFEFWLKTSLEEMSTLFTCEFQKLLPPNINLIYYAQLLDSHNFNDFFKKVKFKEKLKKNFQNNLTGLINEEAMKNFTLAMACSCIGLTNSANSLNYLWVQTCLFDDENIHEIIKKAKKLENISNHASSVGKKGAVNRWEKRSLTQEYAFQLIEGGNYKNNNQAAAEITERVFDYGKTIGFHFSNQFQANKTIYKWLSSKGS